MLTTLQSSSLVHCLPQHAIAIGLAGGTGSCVPCGKLFAQSLLQRIARNVGEIVACAAATPGVCLRAADIGSVGARSLQAVGVRACALLRARACAVFHRASTMTQERRTSGNQQPRQQPSVTEVLHTAFSLGLRRPRTLGCEPRRFRGRVRSARAHALRGKVRADTILQGFCGWARAGRVPAVCQSRGTMIRRSAAILVSVMCCTESRHGVRHSSSN